MAIIELDKENADRDLTSEVTVLTATPNASLPMLCQGQIKLGDGAKDLDGSGGTFELVVIVGGQTIQPSPQEVSFSAAVRAAVWTVQFTVKENDEVVLRVKSPNGADTDVDVTAILYDIGSAGEVIADNVWDEILTGATHNIATSAGRRLRNAEAGVILADGTAQAGGADTMTLAATEPATNDIFNHSLLVITDGTGAGQAHSILDYDGGTKVATVVPAWRVQPDNTSTYTIHASGEVDVYQLESNARDQVNAEVDTALSDWGKTGFSLAADQSGVTIGTVSSVVAIGSGGIVAESFATDALSAAAVSADAVTKIQSGLATGTALTTVAGNVDTLIVDCGTTLPAEHATIAALVAGLQDLSSGEAQAATAAALAAYPVATKAEMDTAHALLATAVELAKFAAGTSKMYLADGAHGGAAATLVLSDYSNFQGSGTPLDVDVQDDDYVVIE